MPARIVFARSSIYVDLGLDSILFFVGETVASLISPSIWYTTIPSLLLSAKFYVTPTVSHARTFPLSLVLFPFFIASASCLLTACLFSHSSDTCLLFVVDIGSDLQASFSELC